MGRFDGSKLSSGRFILTLTAAIVYAYLSIAKILPVDKVSEILLIIIYAYFQRPDRNTKEGEGK